MSMTDLKLVPLHRHPRATAAKRECLTLLEDLTRRVKAGEIESLAVVMVTRDGRALLQRTDIDRLDAMLGGLVRMQRDVLNALDEVDVPEI
jgi:hypothetical protein